MKLKNVSNKIISIGSLTLFPDEIAKVPEGFEKNTNVEALIEKDFVVPLKEKAEPAGETKPTEIPENLEKMKRAELVDFCEAHNIEVAEDDTKAMLVEKIRGELA